MFVASRICVEPNNRIVASALVTPRTLRGHVLIQQSTHCYRALCVSHPCDRPSARGASDAPALAEPLQLKSALRDCLLQRPGVGGHKDGSIGELWD